MKRFFFHLTLCCFLVFLSCEKPKTAFDLFTEQYAEVDFHLTGGRIINGTGEPAIEADLLIKGDEIVFIGQVDPQRIKIGKTISAKGMVITPGFIDPHSHGDPLKTPEFKNFLAMGVTSISLGQDGFSPVYLDLSPWIKAVDSLQPGPNILPFIGHGTLRELSGVGLKANPDENDILKMEEILRNGLEAGCWGMTTGLEYTPGRFASAKELEALARVVGEYDGIIMSHVRNEDDDQVEHSIRELLNQGKFCRVQVSHLKSVYGKGEKRAEELLTLLDSARQEGIEVTADVYPYTASYTGISIVFPDWAKPPYDFQSVKKNRREELADFLRKRVTKRNGPEATIFGSGPYAGKTLAEVAASLNKPFEDVLINDIGPNGASAAYFVMDEELQNRLLLDSLVMVCSDGSPTGRHPRGHGTFARIIEKFVVEKQLLTIEEAVHKMTGLTAKSIGMNDRGILAEGMKADILIFDPARVKETATFEDPFQLAEGMTYVFVNGNLVIEQGSFSEHRHGYVLLKPL